MLCVDSTPESPAVSQKVLGLVVVVSSSKASSPISLSQLSRKSLL